MKKRVVMMAALMMMAGGMTYAQQPETTEPAGQEVSVQAPEAASDETTQEEKAEKDGESKGDCTDEKCGTADSSSSDTTQQTDE